MCEIAYQELATSTRKKVDRLMSHDSQYNTFADACNFADDPRQRAIEHYVNFPRDTQAVTSDECLLADDCLFTAIDADLRVLAEADASDLDKLTAMKFLGHWIGDLHQPLHVSFADDRGGNNVAVTGRCEGSMHSTWDACLIVSRILEEPHTGPQAAALAQRLRAGITDVERDRWHQDNIPQWADESFQIVTAEDTGYCDRTADGCIYDLASNRLTYAGGRMKQVMVSEHYIDAQAPIIRSLLSRAGVRLAYLLNNTL